MGEDSYLIRLEHHSDNIFVTTNCYAVNSIDLAFLTTKQQQANIGTY